MRKLRYMDIKRALDLMIFIVSGGTKMLTQPVRAYMCF